MRASSQNSQASLSCPPAGSRGHHDEAVVDLLQARRQRLPEIAGLPDVDLVREQEARRAPVLRRAIARDDFEIGGILAIEQLLRCVVRVVDVHRRDQPLVLADPASRLAKADAGLLAIHRREDGLAALSPLRADGVQQRQRRRQRGLAVATGQKQGHSSCA